MTNVTGLVRHGIVSRTTSLFGCDEVRAIFTLTRTAPFPLARMMFDVVVIVPPITIVTEMRVRQEPVEGIASLVVIMGFDDAYDLGDWL